MHYVNSVSMKSSRTTHNNDVIHVSHQTNNVRIVGYTAAEKDDIKAFVRTQSDMFRTM